MSRLIAVPTPIGNLEDITLRAIRILHEADLVLAEDTRTSRKLLNHYEIKTPLRAYHQHNEHRMANKIVEEIQAGGTYAIITDAGTPGISDPGYLLIKKCIEKNISVECLPGPTAFVPALVKSGLPIHNFVFEGFLPLKKGRQTKLKLLADEPRTMIFYESPHRLLKTLHEFSTVLGEGRLASVSRELTKVFEETINGTLKELIEAFGSRAVKGEFVIVVEGKK